MPRLGLIFGIYIFSLLAMTGFRYLTRNVYPNLSDLRSQKAEIIGKKAVVAAQIQQLKSPSRIRAWALENKMIPWTTVKKEFREFPPAQSSSSAVDNKPALEVRTKWR